MDHGLLKAELKRDEGMRPFAYKCPAGKTTVGVGRNLDDKGLSSEEVDYLLENDIRECLSHALDIFPGWTDLPEQAQHVIVNMIFQLGHAGFRQFGRLIGAIKVHRWHRAAEEVMDSKAAKQTPARFERHAEVFRKLHEGEI